MTDPALHPAHNEPWWFRACWSLARRIWGLPRLEQLPAEGSVRQRAVRAIVRRVFSELQDSPDVQAQMREKGVTLDSMTDIALEQLAAAERGETPRPLRPPP
jgi:hypothetical protein